MIYWKTQAILLRSGAGHPECSPLTPVLCCVILSKALHLTEPRWPPLYNRSNSPCLAGWGMEVTLVKAQHRACTKVLNRWELLLSVNYMVLCLQVEISTWHGGQLHLTLAFSKSPILLCWHIYRYKLMPQVHFHRHVSVHLLSAGRDL